MDDSAQPKFDSLTVEELRECFKALNDQIVTVFDVFHLQTGVTVTGASITSTEIAGKSDEGVGLEYRIGLEFSFDYTRTKEEGLPS